MRLNTCTRLAPCCWCCCRCWESLCVEIQWKLLANIRRMRRLSATTETHACVHARVRKYANMPYSAVQLETAPNQTRNTSLLKRTRAFSDPWSSHRSPPRAIAFMQRHYQRHAADGTFMMDFQCGDSCCCCCCLLLCFVFGFPRVDGFGLWQPPKMCVGVCVCVRVGGRRVVWPASRGPRSRWMSGSACVCN